MTRLFFAFLFLLGCCTSQYLPSPDDIQAAAESTVFVSEKMLTHLDRQEDRLRTWFGTGVVVARSQESSLVLTAHHVIASFEKVRYDDTGAKEWTVKTRNWLVRTLPNIECSAKVLVDAPQWDLAFLTTCATGVPVTLGDSNPEMWERVLMVGAPGGYHPDGLFAVAEGRFQGLLEFPGHRVVAVLSVPSTPGFSGSGIFWRGVLIGILTHHEADYEHLSYASSLGDIRKVYDQAIDLWRHQ